MSHELKTFLKAPPDGTSQRRAFLLACRLAYRLLSSFQTATFFLDRLMLLLYHDLRGKSTSVSIAENLIFAHTLALEGSRFPLTRIRFCL